MSDLRTVKIGADRKTRAIARKRTLWWHLWLGSPRSQRLPPQARRRRRRPPERRVASADPGRCLPNGQAVLPKRGHAEPAGRGEGRGKPRGASALAAGPAPQSRPLGGRGAGTPQTDPANEGFAGASASPPTRTVIESGCSRGAVPPPLPSQEPRQRGVCRGSS
jgi:hypothetical protein